MSFDLVESARNHVEQTVKELEGESDMLPFMILRTAHDELLLAGLMMPDEEDERDLLGDMMASMIAAWRAKEAIFASCGWVVTQNIALSENFFDVLHGGGVTDEPKPEGFDIGGPPSEHPERKEMIFLIHISPNGEDRLHIAPLMRKDGRVELGDWESGSGPAEMTGRFGDALRMGMELGSHFPKDIEDYIDKQMKIDPQVIVIPISRAFQARRTGGGTRGKEN